MPPAIAGHKRRVGLAEREIAAADQLAGLRIDAFHEVDVLGELPDVLHFGVGAVIDENEAALVRVHHELLPTAVDHQELAHRRIEVPGVVRQLLVVELELAGVGIEPDDRGRIEVGAGPRPAILPIRAAPVVTAAPDFRCPTTPYLSPDRRCRPSSRHRRRCARSRRPRSPWPHRCRRR